MHYLSLFRSRGTACRLLLVSLVTLPALVAQQVSPPPFAETEAEEPTQLSPFEVSTERDRGYTATNTLAGSRLNTSLQNTPAAISVFTKEFLDDIGALDVTEALDYALNGEREFTDYTGNATVQNDLNLQFRGFVGASLGRNYFAWNLASDMYNIERLDFSRGPNSILFGIGGPGGIVNTTSKRARIGQEISDVQFRVGSWNQYRTTVDLARSLGSKFAVRLNLLWQDKESWRDFEYSERVGAALAATYRPFHNTEIRFDGEYGDMNRNQGLPFPAADRITPWLDAGAPLSETYGALVPGTSRNNSRRFVYDADSPDGPISWFGSVTSQSARSSPSLGNNPRTLTDESILPFTSHLAGAGYTNDNSFYNWAFFVDQRIGDLAIEAAFNRQSEKREWYRPVVFDAIAMRGDPNALLPDGRPNPNAGRPYVEGGLINVLRDQIRDDYRLTGSYEWDLRERSNWLGSHRIAGLVSRRDNFDRDDKFDEVNITPDGSAFYPLDLTAGNNLIVRRTYLDFGLASGPRGLANPRDNPIVNVNGVTSGLVRRTNRHRDDLTRVDTQMIAGQSSFLDDRLFLTWGFRNDRQRVWGSTADLNDNGTVNDDRDPVTRLFPERKRQSFYDYSEGNTRTYGIVAHATKWLSLYYNNANNFIPQEERDIDENVVGNRMGEGEDYGIKLSLWDGRVTANIGRYQTSDVGRAVGRDNAFISAINEIWEALGQIERETADSSRDTQDTAGEGWELDLTANPTRNWRLAFNLSQTEQIVSNVQPRNGAYVERHRSLWTQNGDVPLVAPSSGVPSTDPVTGGLPTVTTALRVIDGIYAGLLQQEGQVRRQLREYMANFFTSYSFENDTVLKGWTIGGGGHYRSEPVVGYDSTRNDAPVYGAEYVLFNAMISYQREIQAFRRDVQWKIQLNVDNVFNHDDLIITDKDQTGTFRYVFQNPRRWAVTSTFAF